MGGRNNSGTLHEATPDWQPWALFFLKALRQQKHRLARMVLKGYPGSD
ncbi:hypothetical protein [Parapedobacter soli]|nr:hypothetical protein [Parapedobacter soli]